MMLVTIVQSIQNIHEKFVLFSRLIEYNKQLERSIHDRDKIICWYSLSRSANTYELKYLQIPIQRISVCNEHCSINTDPSVL